MLRRQARQRREYIYRKTVEQRQKAIEDKRERLRHAIDGKVLLTKKKKKKLFLFTIYLYIENHVIPTDLRKDALDIQKTLEWKDEGGEGKLLKYI
jgi:U3 small nucleolar ribonucleoprotein protein IMP4